MIKNEELFLNIYKDSSETSKIIFYKYEKGNKFSNTH